MRRIMFLATVALVMAAMMVAMAMPAFAQAEGSENSCGSAGELRKGSQTISTPSSLTLVAHS